MTPATMTLARWASPIIAAWLLLAAPVVAAADGTTPAAAAAPLPADSLYQLDAGFTDQQGRAFTLADQRGKPALITMFYTSCRYVCPLIIDSLKGVERALGTDASDRLSIVVVSIDPARDDTAALASVAAKRKLDPARWRLARTDEANVRKLAALLGVRYRALADGEFNHTSTLFLLDAEGRRIASSGKLGPVPEDAFVQAVRDAAGSSSGQVPGAP